MKKLFLLAAVALVMASCAKSAADYKKELTELNAQYEQLIEEGNTEEAAKVQQKGMALLGEIMKRCNEDPEFAQEIGNLANLD